MNRRRFLTSVLIPAIASGLAPLRAFAQAFPTKVIKIVASSAPGGNVDLDARFLSAKFPALLGQPAIVENRAGAAGFIGTEYVAHQPPDGHTLLVVASSHTTNRMLHSKMTLDPIKDFSPISLLTVSPFILSVPASSPANSVKDLIAQAKQKPNGITYSTPGIGQGAHLGMELLKTMAGFKATHVPFTGTGPATVALLSNQVDTSLLTTAGALENVKAGKIKALAVTSKKRLQALPNVPTVEESGFADYELLSWIGLLAPAGVPKDVVAKLADASARTFKEPDVLAQLATLESEPVGSTPEEFTAFLAKDVALWERIIKEAGVQGD